ncbi:MAG TPA: hypothetical protein VGF85_10970 [Opitutaceae bacterium]
MMNQLVIVGLLAGSLHAREADPASATGAAPVPAADAPLTTEEIERRANKRYEEMLDKMQAAVEEIAQLYGNPIFLQVFTNDPARAAELKDRLKAGKASADIRGELAGLEKKRDDLMNDIALREREAARISGRLKRQRGALDAIAAAVEQARRSVEETSQ